MALSQNHNFSGEFFVPSFNASSSLSTNDFSEILDDKYKNSDNDRNARTAEEDRPFPNGCDSSYSRTKQRNKSGSLVRTALKDKNISHNGLNCSIGDKIPENDELSCPSQSTISQFDEEQSKTFRNDKYHHDRFTDSLNEKYVCLNFEFNQRHGEYTGKSTFENNDADDVHSDSSMNGLERKYTQVFQNQDTPNESSYKSKKSDKKQKSQPEKRTVNKENISIVHDSNNELKLILKTLKKIFKSPPVASRDTEQLRKLYDVVKTLQEEQEKFRNVIKEQQDQLNNFHSDNLQAQDIIQSQKYEIKQLYSTNTQLENELNINMNQLKEKFQDKVNEVSHLPRAVKTEKAKSEKLSKENCALLTKLNEVKQELVVTKAKLEDVCQKRAKTRNKLKSSERDLKIFRTQNSIFKTEKRTLFEELRKLKNLNDDLKATSTRSISRQKERGDTEQRILRKKIIDLEVELTRSQSSTNALIEERDKLIAELQMQLSTIVHNFEVSQKHIRILRRHIYLMSGNQKCPLNLKS